MSRRWALEVPLHLKADDYSAEACELRLHLYQYTFHRTGGRGFRPPRGTGSKRKNPRMGWGPLFSRPGSLFITARHGERAQ